MKNINYCSKMIKSTVLSSVVAAAMGFSSIASAKAHFNVNIVVDTSGCVACNTFGQKLTGYMSVNGKWNLSLASGQALPSSGLPNGQLYTAYDSNSGDYTRNASGQPTKAWDYPLGGTIVLSVSNICSNAQGVINFTAMNSSNPYTLNGRAKLVITRPSIYSGISCQIVNY